MRINDGAYLVRMIVTLYKSFLLWCLDVSGIPVQTLALSAVTMRVHYTQNDLIYFVSHVGLSTRESIPLDFRLRYFSNANIPV